MVFDKRKYDQQYMKDHIVRKFISFNRGNEEDAQLLEWLQRQPNMAAYIKGLIREDYYHQTGGDGKMEQ